MHRPLLAFACLLPAFLLPMTPAAFASSPHRLLVSLQGDSALLPLTLDPAGVLTPGAPIPAAGKPGPLALSPDGLRVYAGITTATGPAVQVFRRSPDGAWLPGPAVPVDLRVVSLAVDPLDRALWIASFHHSALAVLPLSPDGSLLPPRSAPAFLAGNLNRAHMVLPMEGGRWFLVPCRDSDEVHAFAPPAAAQPAGSLPSHSVLALPQGSGPRHLARHPTLDRVYLLNELDSTLAVLAWDPAAGRLSTLQILSTVPDGYSGQKWSADVHVSPDGRTVYASNRAHDSLAVFALHPATGLAQRIQIMPTEKTPRAFALSPDGRFLLAAGQDSGALSLYAIDPASGLLAARQSFPVGANPSWVLFHP